MRSQDNVSAAAETSPPRAANRRWGRGWLQARARTLWLVLLVVGVIVQGVIWAVIIPPWQAPDEPAHFEMVLLLSRYGRAVTREDRGPSFQLQPEIVASLDRNRFFEYTPWADRANVLSGSQFGQPQVYYALFVPLYRAVQSAPIEIQLLWLRLENLLFSIAVALAAYTCAYALFPGDAFLQITIPAIVAFLPMRGHIGAALNNDNLAVLVVSFGLLVLTRALAWGLTPARLGVVALLVPLTLYSKRVALIAWLLFAVGLPLALALHPPRSSRFTRAWTWSAALAVLGAGAVTAWKWEAVAAWARQVYASATFSSFMPDLAELLRAVHPRLASYAGWTFRSFWAAFAHLTVIPPPNVYILFRALCLAGLVGLVLYAWREWPRLRARRVELATLGVYALGIAATVASILFIYGQNLIRTDVPTVTEIEPQGRYLFPVLIPLATFLMLGLRQLCPVRFRLWMAEAVVFSLALFNVLVWWGLILPYFA